MMAARARPALGLAAALACCAALPAEAKHGDPPAPDSALDCLSRALYFEARGESDRAMTAVAHVVLNRVADPEYPATVCAVVREGGERGPCQFSWWCDGRPDVAWETDQHARALRIARKALAGESDDPTEGANMFHHVGVRPGWAEQAEARGRIGDHLFWRLPER